MTSPKAKWPLQIVVGAKDAASKTLQRINATMSRLKAPVEKVRGLLRMTGVSGGIAKVVDITSDLARKLSLVGTVGGAALGALVNKVTSSGSATLKLSRLLGLNAERLQEWRYAAEQSGIPAENLDKALQKLGTRMAQARAGYGEARQALHALGIQLVDTEGNARGLEEVFPEVAAAIAKVADPGARQAFIAPLFEEENAALVGLLEKGAAGLTSAAEAARAAGAITTEDQLGGFEKFRATLRDIGLQFEGITTQLVTAMLPTIQALAAEFRGWLVDNQANIRAIVEWIGDKLPIAVETTRIVLKDLFEWLRTAFGWVLEKVEAMASGFRAFVKDVKDFAAAPGAATAGALESGSKAIQGKINEIPVLGEIQRFLSPQAEMLQREAQRAAGELKVSFANMPRGARVDRDAAARRSTSLAVGYAMPEVGLG